MTGTTSEITFAMVDARTESAIRLLTDEETGVGPSTRDLLTLIGIVAECRWHAQVRDVTKGAFTDPEELDGIVGEILTSYGVRA